LSVEVRCLYKQGKRIEREVIRAQTAVLALTAG
jgi:hypothetical protein